MLNFPATVALPLRVDLGDVIRVGQTRVTLLTLILDFQQGASPEEIVNHFSTLRLSDVYTVLGYYLDHKDKIDAFVAEELRFAEEMAHEYRAAHPELPTKEQLLARLEARQATIAEQSQLA